MALMTPVSLKLLLPRPSVHNVCHTTLSLHPSCNGGDLFLRALLTWKLRSCLPGLAERHGDYLKQILWTAQPIHFSGACVARRLNLPNPSPPFLSSFLCMFSTLDNDCLCHNHHEAYQVKQGSGKLLCCEEI